MEMNIKENKWKRRLSQISLSRYRRSRDERKKLLKIEQGFGKEGWVKFYGILGMEVDFDETETPEIPRNFENRDVRKAFKKHFLVLAKKVNLNDALLQLEKICRLLDIDLKIEDEIRDYARETSDRRSDEKEYIVRYPDSHNFFHYTKQTVEEIIESGDTKTMRLVEVILRFLYYILFHGWSEWDRMNKSVVCPETGRDGWIAIFRIDRVPQDESHNKPEINSIEEIVKIKKCLWKKTRVYIGFIRLGESRKLDDLPVQVITKV